MLTSGDGGYKPLPAEPEGLTEILNGLKRTVLTDARAARDSSLAPTSSDFGETFLAELRLRRERLKDLVRLIHAEMRLERSAGCAGQHPARHPCRRRSPGSLAN